MGSPIPFLRIKPSVWPQLAALLLSGLSAAAAAGSRDVQTISTDKGVLLNVERAFQLQAARVDEQIQLHWAIAPNYYLYAHRLQVRFAAPVPGVAMAPLVFAQSAEQKRDPNFGAVAVYQHQLDAQLALRHWREAEQPIVKLLVEYQGCSYAGLCYPLQTYSLAITATSLELHNETQLLATTPSTKVPIVSPRTFPALSALHPVQYL